ncbi:MAG: undecaprenyl-diphosphatase UppP [Acidobacteria bacterium]|nr:undecaprenyl-diphosphatase UppP [Acidobacteriota bacterium]
MPATVQAALLGLVQGATEFLPVSSSAHLILARAFFGFDGDKFGLAFDVACHVGTLVAVLIYFRQEIARMVAALPRFDPRTDEESRLIWLLVVGTVPAVIAGLVFRQLIEELRTPTVAAVTLAAGAVFFLIAEGTGAKTRSDRSLTSMEALLIGCAQAIALVPGVSRSGATITVALLLGLRRTEAARFIFLLAIPAIVGAAASEAPKLLRSGLHGTAPLFAMGVLTSALVGYAAVKYFIRYLGNHSLAVFAWYRIALAATVVVWLYAVAAP